MKINMNQVSSHMNQLFQQAMEKPVLLEHQGMVGSLMSQEHLFEVFKPYVLHLSLTTESDGSTTGFFEEIDLAINGANESEVVAELTHDVLEYANDYFDDFARYFQSPNRQAHFPYLLKVRHLSVANEPLSSMIIVE